MSLKQHFELMAEYNRWMNERVYGAAGNLSKSALLEDRRAFFGSILGTLNHIVVGDTIWLKRFAAQPASAEPLREITELAAPKNLNQIIFEDLDELYSHRKWLDEKIIKWISGLTDSDLDFILSYQNTKGVPATKRFSSLIYHFFNHQTHHRGQVTTLLSQSGEDVGVTYLLALIPNQNNV